MDAMNAYTMPGLKNRPILRPADLNRILDIICDYYSISAADIQKRCRERKLVQARHIFMYLVSVYSSVTLIEIGRFFKCRYDHTTVINGRETIKNLMFSDPLIKQQVEYLKNECGL